VLIKDGDNMEIKKFICIQCGKEFEKKVYGKGREFKFCGMNCYWQNKKGKKIEHLKDIQFKKGHKLNLGKKRPDVTLRNLVNNPMKNTVSQEKSSDTHKVHGRWVGRSKAFRYKKEICEVCKSQSNLEVHHIDKNRENNELTNLLVLCKKCHQKIHNRLNELERKNGLKIREFRKEQI